MGSSAPTISSLLMHLKFSIQKADQIDPVCQSIVQHLLTTPCLEADLDRIYYFLEMCVKVSRNDYTNLGMYLVKAILEKIEDELSYETVRRLLGLREELRGQLYSRMN